ncbi:probable inactive receptor kinase RLK902 [Phragmites australis]|uniref:probable inactive receptor kinase RLK902 n=1 Tax=Phragmites australis TaxID=29695 RepID=UPI002D77AB10|nr:probable inactive receptor kinase RLK902 [Phragmites australis]
MARPIGARVVLRLVVVALLVVLPGHVAPDLAGDRAALLALRDALDPGQRLPWDPSAPTPCGGQWRGVVCSTSVSGARVVELRLPAKGLIGTIPVGTVGNLTALRKLSLRFNAISGGIPADVGGCAELRVLSLRSNRLTGAVPEGFFSLALLNKVDLAGNHLTGGVSLEFNSLTQLDTLNLEENNLGGTLPAGLNLPNLAQFNVSFNAQLTGPVPASLARMPASAFFGTGLCGAPLASCANSTPPAPPPSSPGGGSKSGKLSRWAIVGIIVGAVFIILLVMGFFVCLRRRRAAAGRPAGAAADVHEGTAPITVTVVRTDRDAVRQSHSPPLAPAMISDGKKLVFLGSAPERPYDLETLLQASAEVLGKGAFGTTYRATIDGGDPVLVVKKLREVHLSENEFRDKAAALGALHHDNLARLRAYFYSKEEKFLVYDFVGAGSLSALLHNNGVEGRARLDFTARARISLAAARGVAFIHRGGAKSSHGNIKSSNVVITATRDGAYVADYGIAQFVGAAALPRRGAGYRAPEVTDARTVPQSADVYSFGVVVLELLSGRAPAHALPDSAAGVDLPRWVRSVVQEEWTSEVFDSAIANEPRVEEEMMRLLQLGMECTEQRPDKRPSMAEVEVRIERIVEDACRKADFSSTDGSRSVSA